MKCKLPRDGVDTKPTLGRRLACKIEYTYKETECFNAP